MTPAAVRAKIIDMLKAGTTHAAIMAKLQVGRDTVGKVAKMAGLQRARPPRNGVKRPRAYDGASDGTPHRGPKALRPWPAWARFDVSAGLRRRLRHAYATQCPLCKGEGYTIVNGVMDACAACAARERAKLG